MAGTLSDRGVAKAFYDFILEDARTAAASFPNYPSVQKQFEHERRDAGFDVWSLFTTDTSN